MKRRSLWEFLPGWLLTWLVCTALDLTAAALLRLEGRWWLAALLLLVWCALLAAAERFTRFGGMLALGLVALGLCLLLADRAQLRETALALLYRTAPAGRYGAFLLLLLCAAAALLLRPLLRFYAVRAALSLGVIAFWVAAALLEWSLPRPVPAVLSPLLLLTMIETVRRLRFEAALSEPLKGTLLLSFLPLALALSLLPAPAEPYDYPLLHAVTETVEELWHNAETALLYRRKGEGQFSLSFNGFSEEAEVGGAVDKGGTLSVIYAKPEQTPDGALYLFGNAWDHFDGQGWSSTLRQSSGESLNWRLDTAERLYALWRLMQREPDAQFSDYFHLNSVFMSCHNTDLRTLFTVPYATHLFSDSKRFPHADTPTGSLFDYAQRYDVWYRIHFLEPNARTIGALIEGSEGAAYDEEGRALWPQIAEELGVSFPLDVPDELNLELAFAERAALIRSAYLDASPVSERAAALAREITADCESDYEKVTAIAAYLQKNYSYTLHPVPIPKDANFLDWLLFDSREGYCTRFATAAVLLSRSVGVPARYVQGYRCVLPGEVYTSLPAGDAHAWCECYLAGYGWITLEATPGFRAEGYGWLTAAEERTQGAGTGAADAIPSDRPGRGADTVEETAAIPAEADPVGSPDAVSQPEPPRAPWLTTLLILLPAAALPGAWLLLRSRRKRRYAQADPAGRLLLDAELLLRDLRGKGYPRRPEESLQQYFARLPWHYLLSSEKEAAEIAALYDRTFFGMTPPSEAELEKHRAFAARFRPRTLRQWMIWYGLQ